MENKNIGLFFYRGYYSDYFGENGWLKKEEAQQNQAKEKNKRFTLYEDISCKKYLQIPQSSQTFSLKTIYPGLYTGSGYIFGAGLEGEFQSGFLFDYTTGLPYLPGSSVKGAIRSIFPNYTDMGSKIKKSTAQRTERVEYINKEFFEKMNRDCFTSNFNSRVDKTTVVKEIELEIFESRNIVEEKREKEKLLQKGINKEINARYYSIYERDIFYDASISKTVKEGMTKNKFLGLDYITPHKDNPLKNPVPLPFLKILPGVTIDFQFQVHDGYYLTANGKLEFFKHILLDFGVGAKTNVGYGQLKE
ncbi:type III-B CRISPR module RAMP protein Cmr6 [Bacteroidia bacterium]|nr:type III-B CRISPR module RAMP protein Cmr6 [Bacteroidia bacterium]GHV22599.1 type III-B CRISPR module RAMP protein Cmr6 [Bacteroidia bacterium]